MKPLHTAFPFAIYGVHFLEDDQHCIIGGGGGHDIPNRLLVYNILTQSIVSQYDSSKEQIIWSTLYTNKYLLFTSKDQLHLLSLNETTFEWKHLDKMDLFHIENNANKKPIQWNGNDLFVTCDDQHQLVLFSIENDKIKPLCNASVGEEIIDLNLFDHQMICISHKLCSIYSYSNNSLLLSHTFDLEKQLPYPLTLKHEFRSIQIKNNQIVLLCSAKRLPSYLIYLNDTYQVKQVECISKQGGCTALYPSKSRNEVMVVTHQQGYQILHHNKVVYSNTELHGLPITCVDVKQEQQDGKCRVLSGSFDYSIHYQSISFKVWNTYYMLLLLLLLVVLLLWWWNTFW